MKSLNNLFAQKNILVKEWNSLKRRIRFTKDIRTERFLKQQAEDLKRQIMHLNAEIDRRNPL